MLLFLCACVPTNAPRYLGSVHVPRSVFQLLGITCLWIAAKYEDSVSSPSVALMASMTAGQCTVQDMKAMERTVSRPRA